MSVGLTSGLFAAAVGANAFGSALGMAGGIIIVPVLVGIAGAPLPVAIAVSLVSVVACSCASSPSFLAAGIVDLRLAVVLEVATTTGALVGVLLVGVVPAPVLFALFSLVLAVSAAMVCAGGRRREEARAGGAERPRMRLGMGLMFAAGMLATLLGIGAGVLKIPAMDVALRLPIRVSSATANLMIGVTAAGGAGAYLLRGEVDPSLAVPIVLGSVLGSWLGARLLTRAPATLLRASLASVLTGLALLIAIGVAGLGPFGRVA
jgi:uncharacterized membrane protein YfcA